MSIRIDNKVAIVTGAGTGLGRSHALGLAARGAKVVINDLGVSRDGSGASQTPAEEVASEITAAGGEAIAHGTSVTDAAARWWTGRARRKAPVLATAVCLLPAQWFP